MYNSNIEASFLQLDFHPRDLLTAIITNPRCRVGQAHREFFTSKSPIPSIWKFITYPLATTTVTQESINERHRLYATREACKRVRTALTITWLWQRHGSRYTPRDAHQGTLLDYGYRHNQALLWCAPTGGDTHRKLAEALRPSPFDCGSSKQVCTRTRRGNQSSQRDAYLRGNQESLRQVVVHCRTNQ